MYNIEVQETHSGACTKLKKKVYNEHIPGTCTNLKKKMFKHCLFKIKDSEAFDLGNLRGKNEYAK